MGLATSYHTCWPIKASIVVLGFLMFPWYHILLPAITCAATTAAAMFKSALSATITCMQKLRSMVHEIVGRINGHYGTLTHVPIHHLDRQLSFHELCALYAITDVALVTSLRDGMNLVSYEYVACQSDNAGKQLPALLPK